MGDAEAAIRQIQRWKQSPMYFAVTELQATPDNWQKKVLEVLPSQDKDKIRISMQACAGPGKSALLAWVIWWFMASFGEKGEHPKGAAVSTTSDNLKDNLWPECAKWQSRSPFLMKYFKWTKERIFSVQNPETWFMSARSWSKTANEEEQGRTLSGLHSKFVLVVVDESGDIPISVLKAGEQALSNCKWGKILQAGNPTTLDGMLYDAATRLRDQWHVVRITGDPDDPDRSPRIDKEWAKKQIELYGRGDPWVMSYILGQFPPSSINSLLGPDEVEAAMSRHLREDEYSWAQKRIGVDVARFGDDRTVLFPRQGLVAFQPTEMRDARGPDIAARLVEAKGRWKSELEFVDDTGGYGASVIDACLQAGVNPMAINFSGKATDPRYYNKRSEMWFEMQKWVRRGGVLPRNAQLAKELTTPTYTFVGGKFRLEEKDQIKKRLKFSPDFADALALTWAMPEMPTQEDPIQALIKSGKAGKLESEYDPFDEARL